MGKRKDKRKQNGYAICVMHKEQNCFSSYLTKKEYKDNSIVI